ncbi:MAG TPA: indole-3-glycerol phosphate synthase TrpC [Candidatus Acidoferrales bacterium]|nr:indole-3-glycerol phosphate synthase TrpC [Candidatus Acidoferrales bacterium]
MSGPAADFLARIASDRRKRLEQMRLATPAHVLRELIVRTEPAGRLERALRRERPTGALRLLCEVKRASPSKGMLNAAVDPVETAKLYAAGGAAAISLVTEPDHFGGDPAWLDRVRPHVAVPLLLKDFVLDSYQILDAAARRADGVLLLAALLSETEIQRFVTEARLLGLDALVEVHDETELHRALNAGATLVGINNRSLHTFEVDLQTSLRLLPLLPAYATAVAESGLSRPADLERLRGTRCDAVLMGEVFMTSPDPAATLAGLAAAARGDA